MNRINPLYIIALLVTILIVGIFKLQNIRNELKELKKSYKETKTLSTELSMLKAQYKNSSKIKISLRNILKNPILKSSLLDYSFKKSSLFINSKSIDINALNFLMSKILNASYQINKLDIKRLNDKTASFKMEIIW